MSPHGFHERCHSDPGWSMIKNPTSDDYVLYLIYCFDCPPCRKNHSRAPSWPSSLALLRANSRLGIRQPTIFRLPRPSSALPLQMLPLLMASTGLRSYLVSKASCTDRRRRHTVRRSSTTDGRGRTRTRTPPDATPDGHTAPLFLFVFECSRLLPSCFTPVRLQQIFVFHPCYSAEFRNGVCILRITTHSNK